MSQVLRIVVNSPEFVNTPQNRICFTIGKERNIGTSCSLDDNNQAEIRLRRGLYILSYEKLNICDTIVVSDDFILHKYKTLPYKDGAFELIY